MTALTSAEDYSQAGNVHLHILLPLLAGATAGPAPTTGPPARRRPGRGGAATTDVERSVAGGARGFQIPTCKAEPMLEARIRARAKRHLRISGLATRCPWAWRLGAQQQAGRQEVPTSKNRAFKAGELSDEGLLFEFTHSRPQMPRGWTGIWVCVRISAYNAQMSKV